MNKLSNYPPGTWSGDPLAPWNQPDAVIVACPNCSDDVEVSDCDLCKNKREVEQCFNCSGAGGSNDEYCDCCKGVGYFPLED